MNFLQTSYEPHTNIIWPPSEPETHHTQTFYESLTKLFWTLSQTWTFIFLYWHLWINGLVFAKLVTITLGLRMKHYNLFSTSGTPLRLKLTSCKSFMIIIYNCNDNTIVWPVPKKLNYERKTLASVRNYDRKYDARAYLMVVIYDCKTFKRTGHWKEW
jgi:hypothetical protein